MLDMSDKMCEDTLKLKQSIIDEGLYEVGMSVEDMQQLYKTLKRSKKTATDEIEYRELLSQTDLNCSQMEVLKTETDVGDVDRTSNTDVHTVISDKPFKEKNLKNKLKQTQSKLVDNNTHINFSFNTSDNYKPIMSIKRNKNVVPILYHHPAFFKLPAKKKSEMILLYLQQQLKQVKMNQDEPPIQWSKPIGSHADSTFENELSVEQESELTQLTDNNVTEINEIPSKDFIVRKSARRIVKRKIYEDGNSEDEFSSILNKKTKSNTVDSNTVNKNIEQKLIETIPSTSKKKRFKKAESDEDFSPILNKRSKVHNDDTVIVNKTSQVSKSNEIVTRNKRWISNKFDVQKSTKAVFLPDVSDRTNKLFDKLKEDDNKIKSKEITVNLNEDSDSSDDIFPVSKKTVVNIHTEVTPKLKKGKGVAKKTQPKSRRKFNLKTTNEEKQENNTTDVSTMTFYGKNKENELDASNNNKSTTSKMIQCPICSRSFPDSEIEEHASSCDQFEDSQADSLCDICNKYVLNVDMDAHKFQCIEKIENDSIEKPCDKNKSNLGYLCACGKYVVDGNQMDHANSCIAPVDDG